MDHMQKNELLLTQLILMFQTAAMQHLGKIKNPITDKIERDLPQAQISIDMLDMLREKMKGNLTEPETHIINSVVQDLKLNFVDEKAKETAPAPSGADAAEKTAQ
jgi:hypothetical protein